MHARNEPRRGMVAGLALALVACGGTDVVATEDGSASTFDAGSLGDGAVESRSDGAAPSDGRTAFCAGRGPAVTLPGAETRDECAGALAERVFRYAVCTCEALEPVGTFRSDSLHSGEDAETTDSGGPVGTNGTFSSTATVDIGGTLTAAGSGGVSLIGPSVRIGGDLRAAGNVMFAGNVSVARDAVCASNISGSGTFTVARDLRQPPGATAVGVSVGRDAITEAVSIAPPCPCGDDDLLDVGAIVAAAQTDNHNAEVDLAPDAFRNLVSEHRIELPCGRFYLDAIGGIGDLTLVVRGRTALFVGADVTVTGTLNVELGPEGELDVLIAGDLGGAGTLSFGDPARPAATRVYVGGGGDVNLTGSSAFVGNLYAPRAPITIAGGSEVYGSLFGRQIDATGTLSVHYDRAILEVGEDCPDVPPPVCDQCGDCPGGYACGEGGTCAAECTSDAECCDPLTCDTTTGVCTSILF